MLGTVDAEPVRFGRVLAAFEDGLATGDLVVVCHAWPPISLLL